MELVEGKGSSVLTFHLVMNGSDHLQEENSKLEKLTRECVQPITSSITNCMEKDVPVVVEKILKKELSAVVLNITRSMTPFLEKAVSSEIAESFQA